MDALTAFQESDLHIKTLFRRQEARKRNLAGPVRCSTERHVRVPQLERLKLRENKRKFPIVFSVLVLALAATLAACSGSGTGNTLPSQAGQSVLPAATGNPLPNQAGQSILPSSTVATTATSYSSAVLSSSPSRFYKLTDSGCCTALDASGHQNGIYPSGTNTYGVTGPIISEGTTAISVPGSSAGTAFNQGVSTTIAAASGTSYSVEIWVKPAFLSSTNQYNAYQALWGQDSAHRLLMNSTNGQLLAQFNSSSSSCSLANCNLFSNAKLNNGQWNYVVYVWNNPSTATCANGTETLYINGVQDASACNIGPNEALTGTKFYLGEDSSQGAYHFWKGGLGDFAFYPSVLTSSTVSSHHGLATSSGTSSTPTPTASITPAPTATSTPSTCTSGCVTPLAASSFNDSIGVNTHLDYQGSAYDTGYNSWSSLLLNSRIKRVRDDFCNWGTANSWCAGTWAPRFNQFAAAGIKFDIVTNPWMGWTSSSTGCHGTCLSGYPSALGLPISAIDTYEGPNECDVENSLNCTDVGSTSGLSKQQVIAQWSPYVANLRSSSVSVLSPSFSNEDGYGNYSSISGYTNGCSIHDYQSASETPEYYFHWVMPVSGGPIVTWYSGCQHLVGNQPMITTESGYTNDTSSSCPDAGISELGAERYFPRELLTHLNGGIKRVYTYELLDGESGSTSCYAFGLLHTNFTPKLIWNRMAQLMNYFADSGTSPQTPLAYTLTGDTTGTLNRSLFQRSNGTYILVPWLATQLWNGSNLSPTSETLTLTLPSSVTSITVTTFGDSGAMSTQTISGSNGTFSLPVSSLVEAVSFTV